MALALHTSGGKVGPLVGSAREPLPQPSFALRTRPTAWNFGATAMATSSWCGTAAGWFWKGWGEEPGRDPLPCRAGLQTFDTPSELAHHRLERPSCSRLGPVTCTVMPTSPLSPQRGREVAQYKGSVSAELGGPHQCFGQRFDSAQLHSPRSCSVRSPFRGCNGFDGAPGG